MRTPASYAAGIALALTALLGILHPLPARALPSSTETWIQVESEHFTLISNAGEGTTVKLAEGLERFRAVLGATAIYITHSSPVPILVYVFKSRRDYLQYASKGTAGFFTPRNEANFVVMDASRSEYALPIIYHEFVHLWVEMNVPGVPLWLNEGLAEFYSTFQVEEGGIAGGRRTVRIGKIHPHHGTWLRMNPLIPLEELLTMDSSSLDYDEDDRTGGFYAESWALVHSFLMGDGGDPGKLDEYVSRTSAGQDPVITFESVFQTGIGEAEARLREYTEAGRYRYRSYELAKAVAVEKPRIRTLAYDELLVDLGMLRADIFGRGGDPATYFRSALDVNRDNARAHAWMARILAWDGNWQGVDRHLGEARRLAPEDPEVYRLAAAGIEERLRSEGEGPHDPPTGSWDHVAALFGKALELAPDSYAARFGMGLTYYHRYDADPAEGAALLEQVVDANPARLEPLVNWIVLLARAGDLDRAWDLLDERLRPRGEANAIREAEYALVQREAVVAGRLFEAGDRDSALVRLQTTVSRARTPDVRRAAVLNGSLITGQVSRKDEVSRYNDLVRLVNEGHTDDVLSKLQGLIPTLESKPLRKEAEALKARLETIQHHNAQVRRYNEAIRLIKEGQIALAQGRLQRLLQENPDEDLAWRIRELLDQMPD